MSETGTSTKYIVRFLPDDIEVTVDKGTNLLSAALQAGVHVNTSCGGTGVCGTCKVKVDEGTVESRRTDKVLEKEYLRGLRLACQTYPLSDLTVTIPLSSRLGKAVQARENKQSSGVSAKGWSYNPPVKKYYLELPAATSDDNSSDLFRLERGLEQTYHLRDLPVDFEVIQKLSSILRKQNWKVTVTVLEFSVGPNSIKRNSPRIINIEPGDTRQNHYALAIDIGTTTVCSQLLDLNKGEILADTIVFNQQKSFGDDVISRINYSQKNGGLTRLQEAVVASVNETIENLLESSRIDRKDINHVTIAGNTTMQQILLGLDPQYIRLSPYTPVATFLPLIKAHTLGINVASQAYLYVFPSPSSYVGGDITSGIVSCGLYQRKKLTFYMDIGTNGEIVIGNSDWMVTASCSAGPTFEGGGIKFGMVAMKGAIENVTIDPSTLEPTLQTIGNAKPQGLCGSGLISTLASLLEAGALGQNGKFNTNLNSSRIRPGNDNYEYVLAWASETRIGQDIVITEVDIDNLIRAKAAMYAGCHTLARSVNVTCADFEQVILAGNFGNSLDIEKAITIGLLPDIPRDRFVFVGNGSLSGARLVSFSVDLLEDSSKVAQMMTNIELSENNNFTENYIAALFLPHTNEKAFPSIMKKLKI